MGGFPEQVVECVPNVSEGRRAAVVEQLCTAASGVAGAYLLDVHSDYDHHRSVFTIVGSPGPVAEAVFRLAVERGWTLRELSSQRASLEDVFIQLTTEEPHG